MLALIVTGAGQGLAQKEVGDGGWALERVIGRGTVEDLAVSPDGSTLAVAGSRGIWLYSLPDLELRRHIDIRSWPFHIEWSPDSRSVATMDRNSAVVNQMIQDGHAREQGDPTAKPPLIRLWDVANGSLVHALQDSQLTARFAWSPVGDMLAGISYDGVLRTWDAASGGAQVQFTGYPFFLLNFAWSPDGQRVALLTGFELLGVLDVNSRDIHFFDAGPFKTMGPGEIAKVLENIGNYSPTRTVRELGHYLANFGGSRHAAWSPDGEKIAVRRKEFLAVYQPPVPDELFRNTFDSSMAPVWSPDGKRLAQDTRYGANVTDAATGELLLRLEHLIPPYPGYDVEYGLTGLAWSRDGRQLASAAKDERVVIHDSSSGDTLAVLTHDMDVHHLSWSHNQEQLVSSTAEGQIYVWDARDWQQLATTTEHSRDTPWYLLRHSSWGPDSRHVYAAGRYLDATTGQPGSSAIWPEGVIPSRDHRFVANPLVKQLTVVIQDAETLEPLKELEYRSIPLLTRHIVWSPDGYGIALGSVLGNSYSYDLWDTGPVAQRTAFIREGAWQAGKKLQNPTLAWSSDARLVATNAEWPPTSDEGNLLFPVLVREAYEGAVFEFIPTQTSRMSSLDWSADGRFLAGGGDDGSLTVWDMDWSGSDPLMVWQTKQVVEDHGLNALAWSPDGTKLAAGTASPGDPLPGAVLVYDWKNGALENEARLPGHSVGIVSLAWSPDGSRLASTDLGGVVHVWRAAVDGQDHSPP